jgi:hypothetical protein
VVGVARGFLLRRVLSSLRPLSDPHLSRVCSFSDLVARGDFWRRKAGKVLGCNPLFCHSHDLPSSSF